ncbi:MAG TPA: DUF3540 domain-containing protein [Byssovorax sp.]|jgi:hypothetical protein
MTNAARKIESSTAVEEAGTVARVADGAIHVQTSAGEYRAARAASCLVAPAPGDVVLVSTLADGESYVVAVLERPGAGSTALEIDGDLSVRAPAGRVVVAARDGIDLAASRSVSIVAGAFDVTAREASLAFEALDVVSTRVRAELGRVKTVAAAIDTVVDRWTERVKRSYRRVDELDQVRAGRIDYEAKKSMNLRAESAILTAEELVKIDGGQVHLG